MHVKTRLHQLSKAHRFIIVASAALLGGLILLVTILSDPQSSFKDRAIVGTLAGAMMAFGAALLIAAAAPPTAEILRLAQSCNGVLTLGEIITTLNVDPQSALRALKKLQKVGLANPRWQEFRRNIWEFPDYMQLPIAETLDLAKTRGGKVSLKDLLAQGHSLDVAQQTLDTLSQKGLAQQDPASTSPSLILESQ